MQACIPEGMTRLSRLERKRLEINGGIHQKSALAVPQIREHSLLLNTSLLVCITGASPSLKFHFIYFPGESSEGERETCCAEPVKIYFRATTGGK
jgi:hypothetical protein